MAMIGRKPALAPLSSADIPDGVVRDVDLAATLDLTSKTVTLTGFTATGTITTTNHGNSSEWAAAYSWGDHSAAGYQAASSALTTATTFSGDVSGTYNSIVVADNSHNHEWANITNLPDPVITLAGDVSGSATMTNLGSATITVTVADDSHIHDTRYYTETEIDNYFSGLSAITGYNKTNWDTAYGWGNHASVGYLTGNQTITLTGDVSGSGTTSIAVTIADDSHNHVISNVDGLQSALDAKLASSSYTAADVLSKLLTVDGASSGIDADLLDGVQGSSYLRSDQSDTMTGDLGVSGAITASGNINTNSYIDVTGHLYSRSNLRVLDAAGTGWNTWATRSNGAYNLDVGIISTSGGTSTFNSGRIALRSDGIEDHATATDTGFIQVNYYGYQNGHSYFRNFDVYNGKGGSMLSVQGAGNYTQINGSTRSPIFYDSANTGFYVDPASTSNLNTVSATDAFRSSRFEEYDGTFAFRISGASGTTRHINLWDSTGDPSEADGSSVTGISWGKRTDSNPYYIIYADKLHTYGGDYSKLILAWHTGVHIGGSTAYGGTRFWNDAPGIGSPTELMSVGKGDNHVRVTNNVIATRFRSANGTVTPYSGATFSNVFTNEDSGARVAYFDGKTSGAASVWWGAGANPHAALDSTDGNLDIWVNPSNNAWSRILNYGTSGITVVTGNVYAPVYYDGANTSYYADPASISSFYGLAIRGDTSSTDSANQIFFWDSGDTTTSAIGFKANGGEFGNPTGQGDGYNTYFTMDTDARGWVFRRGTGGSNFTSAYNAGWILNNGIAQFNQSTRSPVFYDSNNTGYYVDPFSTSRLYNLELIGSKHTYLQIAPGVNHEAMVRYVGGESGLSWYVGKRTTTQLAGAGGFHFYSESAGQTNCGMTPDGSFIARADMRAPRYYDSNNTGYYIDAASNSVIDQLTVGTTSSGDNKNIAMQVGGDNNYSAIRMRYGANERQQMHFFGPTWGSNFTSQSRGAINISGNQGVTFGPWNVPAGYVDNSGNAGFRGNVTAYAYSDIRLKHDVRPIFDDPLSKLMLLRGVRFDWDDEYVKSQHGDEDERWCPKHDVGMIAQEVQEVLPEITVEQDSGYLAVRYEKMIPLLVESIKQQQSQIEALVAQIESLKEMIQ